MHTVTMLEFTLVAMHLKFYFVHLPLPIVSPFILSLFLFCFLCWYFFFYRTSLRLHNIQWNDAVVAQYQRQMHHAEYELQFLHPLPSELLQNILYEPYDQPSMNDADNVNEFRRVYDDFYGRVASNDGSETGKKRVPPTRPYVQFLMLYDLLKRESKRLMLQTFEVRISFATFGFVVVVVAECVRHQLC